MNTALTTFAAVFAALYAAHHVGDHWVQSHHQASHKAGPGWAGRLHCAAHVVTYTLTAAAFLGVLVWQFDLALSFTATAAGLAVSAITHYLADRRVFLKWLARVTGHAGFWDITSNGINGPYLLDQSYHVGWLFITAVIIAGGAS